MTHPIRVAEAAQARSIGRPRAAVKVRSEKDSLVSVLSPSALVVSIPERLRVVQEDGTVVQPSEGTEFLITTETFDPYHLVTQIPKGGW